jgi:putative Mn2+ efflux pump MntP
MSGAFLTLVLLLSVDSFAASAALGALNLRRPWRYGLALLFGLCDGLAAYVSLCIGADGLGAAQEWCEWLGPVAVAAYGLFVLALAWYSRRLAASPGPARWLVLGVPVCLALDNLVAGAKLEGAGLPPAVAALCFGLVSGALALLGLFAGAALAGRVRLRAEWLGGAALVCLAVVLCCKQLLS